MFELFSANTFFQISVSSVSTRGSSSPTVKKSQKTTTFADDLIQSKKRFSVPSFRFPKRSGKDAKPISSRAGSALETVTQRRVNTNYDCLSMIYVCVSNLSNLAVCQRNYTFAVYMRAPEIYRI